MVRCDDLCFERMKSLAEGFGWTIKKTEVTPGKLEIIMERDRDEPETDITVKPT